MIQIILAIICIKLVAFATYLVTEILAKYIYSYSKNLNESKKVFLLIYSGLLFVLLPSITSINLSLLGESRLAYYNLIYNVLLDATVSSGILILISNRNEKIAIDRKIIFIISLIFTVNIFLVIKGAINIYDSYILFLLFILSSIFLLRGQFKETSTLNIKQKNSNVDLLAKIFFIVISFSIFVLCGQILSYLSIYLKKILNNVSLVAYTINLISNTLPTLFFGYFIYKESKNFEEGHISVLGQFLYSFTICLGIISGIFPIVFTFRDSLAIVSSFLALYSSLVILNLYAYGYNLPKEIGIFLIILGFMVGLTTI